MVRPAGGSCGRRWSVYSSYVSIYIKSQCKRMIWLRGQAKFEAPVFYVLAPHWSSCVFCFFPFAGASTHWVQWWLHETRIEPVCPSGLRVLGLFWWFILMCFLWFLLRSPGKNYSYAIKFTPGSAGFNMVRKYKFLGLYKVDTYLGCFFLGILVHILI